MFQITPEVAGALDDRKPVVALESTLITHGLPWPTNLETAIESEAAVRKSGAVPATIAVLDGVIRLGLDLKALERLATSQGVLKASRRDLGAALSGGRDAATTVSATLWVAYRASIGVVATGGIGGIHRGAATSFDISTDLDALARANGILLVCSGVKTILDVAATLEALETRGVLVIGYQTDDLPGFTVATTGLPLDWRVDTPEAAASMVDAHRQLGLPGAVLLAQEVPSEMALDPIVASRAIDQALSEATSLRRSGKAITPHLLDAVCRATGGASLRANRGLIVQNAGLAGAVAAKIKPPLRVSWPLPTSAF